MTICEVKAKICTVERVLRVESHPNADRLDLLRIQGYETVSAKGHGMKVGDKVLFVHPDSIVPHDHPYFSFMESHRFRVKPIKLRGIFSIGLVINPAQFKDLIPNIDELEIGDEVSDILGITHYTKPVPGESGKGFIGGYTAGDFPTFLRKTDEINARSDINLLKRFKATAIPKYPSMLKSIATVIATIKIDGTSATFAKDGDGVFSVCSRNRKIKRPTEDVKTSVYWDIAKKFNIEECLPINTCLQGEIYGPGIQCNPLNVREVSFSAFNLFDIPSFSYLTNAELIEFCHDNKIPFAQIMHEWEATKFVEDETIESLVELTNKVEYSKGIKGEGLVFRHLYYSEENFLKYLEIPKDRKVDGGVHLFERDEMPYFSFKLINEKYKD